MISKAILIGKITEKSTKKLKSGGYLTTLKIETVKTWRNKNKKTEESPNFHVVHFFDLLQQAVNKDVEIGDAIYLEGDINHKYIVSADGIEKWNYSIKANFFKKMMLQKELIEECDLEYEDNKGNR
jgi:single-stranded DNA-binding protein